MTQNDIHDINQAAFDLSAHGIKRIAELQARNATLFGSTLEEASANLGADVCTQEVDEFSEMLACVLAQTLHIEVAYMVPANGDAACYAVSVSNLKEYVFDLNQGTRGLIARPKTYRFAEALDAFALVQALQLASLASGG